MTQSQRVESLSHAQRERLAYIDFRLYFFGEIGRPDLIERFGVAPAGATRDLALYREIAPQNITFDGSNKIYRIGQAFSPLFDHASQRVLSALSDHTELFKQFSDNPNFKRWLTDTVFDATYNPVSVSPKAPPQTGASA